MEALLVLLLLYLALALIVLPIWTITKILQQDRESRGLRAEILELHESIRRLRTTSSAAPTPPPSAPTPAPAPIAVEPTEAAPAAVPPLPVVAASAAVAPAALESPAPAPEPAPEPVSAPPPLVSPPAVPPPVYQPPEPSRPVINWEQFMGAKLFAWLGGLALFLGVAFFVKYSFEHDLIPPEVRVSLGFLLGLGLIVGGLWIPRVRYAITAQTLVGSGVVSLYAVTFACNSIYHFAFFGPGATFLLMTLVTSTAFVLAVRLEAQAVALLGLLGGFLTPVLLSTGQDNPVGLFGYVALLDLGLAAVALHRRWLYLVPLAAFGTVVMIVGWADHFLTPGSASVAMVVCTGFSVFFYALCVVARRLGQSSVELLGSALGLTAVGFGFALHFVQEPAVAAGAGRFLGYLAAIDLVVLALVWLDERLNQAHAISGIVVFGLLAFWINEALTDALLPWALGAALGFAALHAVFPIVLRQRRPEMTTAWWSQFFPPLSLLLMLIPLFRLEAPPLLVWPAVLLVDLLAVGLALVTYSIIAVGVVLVLTLVATAVCLFRVSPAVAVESSLLLVIGAFAVFFFAAGLWLARRLGDQLEGGSGSPLDGVLGGPRAQLPAFASILPFLLLILVCERLAVPDPTPVFGLGLLLVVLTLGLTVLLRRGAAENSTEGEWLPACALAGIAAVQFAWHSRHFSAEDAAGPLGWYCAFYALFTIYPFVFRTTFAGLTGPWAISALAGLAQFWLVYRTITVAWPSDLPGVIPALFTVAPLTSLGLILRRPTVDPAARLNQLAWYGGVALAFITLVFPIQFERQWLTVAWALEGAALLWLFRRVPHPGLRLVGVALLVTAFVRLALNQAIFSYHVRGEVAVLNWYLYAYGLAIASLLVGARLLSGGDEDTPDVALERGLVLDLYVPPVLNALAIILAFILLNLEVADYFTAPGARALAFQFTGNFARDMTYTIAWALFALGLLGIGIWRAARPARYAAIGLLSVTLLKLFLHDLARLEALYRIGALFAVAVIAILASFAYQRFLPSNEPPPPPPS
ncbi:MAG TPA: DUF2339 domain-containing protein [Opitutaceae bacterium]|nr:DUF2339 domain-containing protein [Opitutaceae bacterium]